MKTYYFKLFRYWIIPLLLIISYNCSGEKNHLFDNKQIVIPDSLYSFFPKKDSLYLKLYSMRTNAEKRNRIGGSTNFLEAHLEKIYTCGHVTQFDLLIHEYKTIAIDSLKPTNDNYFIVKYAGDMLKMYDYITLKEKYQESINKYILPSFHNFSRYQYGLNYNFTTICGLPEDYEILIMKSGRNYVLPNNDMWNFEWKLLPPELKHGYTSGIAYRTASDKIIYWCVAW